MQSSLQLDVLAALRQFTLLIEDLYVVECDCAVNVMFIFVNCVLNSIVLYTCMFNSVFIVMCRGLSCQIYF